MLITPSTNPNYSVIDNYTLLELLTSPRDYCNSLMSNILLKLTERQLDYLTSKAAALSKKIEELNKRMSNSQS